MNILYVNGIKITCGDGNISVNNGAITIDGKKIDVKKELDVTIVGNCNHVNICGNLIVKGNIGRDVDITGNLDCDEIKGNVDSTGNIRMKR